jgi:hypothetical protein
MPATGCPKNGVARSWFIPTTSIGFNTVRSNGRDGHLSGGLPEYSCRMDWNDDRV